MDLAGISDENVKFDTSTEKGENLHYKDPQDWEYPELNENMEDLEADDDVEENGYDIPDYRYDSNENDSVCKPYMDKATLWIQSLLDNVKKDELWKSVDSDAIKSNNRFF